MQNFEKLEELALLLSWHHWLKRHLFCFLYLFVLVEVSGYDNRKKTLSISAVITLFSNSRIFQFRSMGIVMTPSWLYRFVTAPLYVCYLARWPYGSSTINIIKEESSDNTSTHFELLHPIHTSSTLCSNGHISKKKKLTTIHTGQCGCRQQYLWFGSFGQIWVTSAKFGVSYLVCKASV